MTAVPDYLYRHTNINNLKHILQDRTIRFSPLDKMDDETEMKSCYENVFGRFLTEGEGQYVFISCWTDKEEEDIKMWNDYCRPNEEGVRIKLPIRPFSETENLFSSLPLTEGSLLIQLKCAMLKQYLGKEPADIEEDIAMTRELEKKNPHLIESFREYVKEVMRHAPTFYAPEPNKNICQIEYTDDLNKIYPTIYHLNSEINWADYGPFGMVKPTSWAWQKEWRYYIICKPYIPGKITANQGIIHYPLPFDHIDVKLDIDKLKELEITLNPWISSESRNVVEQLVRDSGLSIPVYESRLK
ncbi:MAG: hypothetical protein IKH57_11020 [Clostridia bacterium]|nr:hypothetical protein [Clostridia bacterium]